MNLAELLTPYQFDNVNRLIGNLADASVHLLRGAEAIDAATVVAAIPAIASELRRLNDNLEAGTLHLRTHHPKCITPKLGTEYSIEDLEAMGKFINQAIATRALVLPSEKKGGES